MDFNKIPRWMLVWGFVGCMTLGSVMLKGAFADLDSTKDRSLRTEQSVQNLQESFAELKVNLTSFQNKYDRNQEENQKVFREILRAVKS